MNLFMKRYLILLLLALAGVSSQGFEVTLAWDANSEADLAGYRIYYAEVGSTNVTVVEVGLSAEPRETIGSLELGKAYEFYATAFNRAGLESEPSEKLVFTVPPRPGAPKGLRVVVTVEVVVEGP